MLESYCEDIIDGEMMPRFLKPSSTTHVQDTIVVILFHYLVVSLLFRHRPIFIHTMCLINSPSSKEIKNREILSMTNTKKFYIIVYEIRTKPHVSHVSSQVHTDKFIND